MVLLMETPRVMYLVFVLCYLIGVCECQYENVTYTGILTPSCVQAYYKAFVARRVPPRNYQYHHEYLTGKTIGEPETDAQLEDEQSKPRWRIVGGKEVAIEEVPYQVLYGLYCGGILIAPEWVLTAAHCKEREKFILAGSTYRSQATRYRICAHFVHPLWNSTKLHSHDYDYQLLLLEKPVPVTAQSRPIEIGKLSDIQPGKMVAVSGWGHMKYKQGKMQDHIRKVFVPVLSHEECTSLPQENYKKITSRMFCAGFRNGTKDSCQGDSGGPAVIDSKLVGLVSFGIGCALPDRPGVYSNVPAAREWIRYITALPL